MLSQLARLAVPAVIVAGLTLGGAAAARADHERDFGYGYYGHGGYGDHCDYDRGYHYGYRSYRPGSSVYFYYGRPSYRSYDYDYGYGRSYYRRPSYARRTYGYGIYYGWGF